jgi:hypothetical protein
VVTACAGGGSQTSPTPSDLKPKFCNKMLDRTNDL